MNDELPQGWATASFMDVFDIQGGTQPPKKTFKYEATKGYVRLLQIRDFGEKPVPTFIPSKPTFKTCRADDILIGRYGASVGRICTGMEGAYNVALTKVIIPKDLSGRYVFWLLQSPTFQRPLLAIERSAQNGFNKEDLAEIMLPIAPVNEEHRIVAKLEKLLGQVDSCHERLAKIPALLKRFRQSVLAAACSGKLTEDWREENPSDQTAAAIVEAIRRRREGKIRTPSQRVKLTEIYGNDEENDSENLPLGWKFVALRKLCESFDYGTSTKSEPTGKVPVLRMGNIQSGKLDWKDLVYTSDESEIDAYQLKPKTVLFNRTNSPELVGKTAIYLGERLAIFAGYLIRVNQYQELDPEYLNFCLNTSYARAFCQSVKTDGVSQSNINAQKLGQFEVPFCRLGEQKEIVRRVKRMFALADRIEGRFAEGRRRVDSITQSLLAKAFRGELVPTEAELAKAEGRSFESAEELLARIKANGKPASEKTKRIRKPHS